MEEEGSDEAQEVAEQERVVFGEAAETQPIISLQALQGMSSFQTMKVTGRVGLQPIHILIDSGSTHNFLDITTAKKLRCELLKIPPIRVAVGDGAQLSCQFVCRVFNFTLSDMEHTTDIYIVPLGCCDMVLGIQWLATLGSILWNFAELTMEFSVKGEKQLLQGNRQVDVKWPKGKEQRALLQAAQLFALHIVPAQEYTTSGQTEITEPQLSQLLDEYADLFTEPKSLPPPRSHDHKIVLKEGTSPINVRPYRYPALQKDIIEKIVKEMLEAGVVRPSQSPYSSPIVLVKKKDGSWRLCVDYRC